MPDMNDDAVDRLQDELRRRMFTSTVTVDSRRLPATPRRYFETAEGGVLDVQAVLGDAPLVYVGDAALTASGARGLADYLHEVLAALP